MKAPRKIPLFDNSLKKAIEAVHPDMKSTSTLEDVYSQAHHHMIVAQLSECNDINSFLRIAYTCFKQPSPAHNVRVLSDYLIRNVYHFHSRGVSYDELLAAVHTIRFRLVDQGLELPQSLLIVGVVLAGGHSEHLWTEWELWLKNRASTQLTAADSANTPKRFVRSDGSLDLQTWIDLCFVDCFISLSDWEKAWAVVSHSKIAPEMLSRGSLDQLIEHSEHEPADYWKSSGDLLRDLYARKLHAIEKSLGVKWVWKEDEGMGWHVIDIGRENVFESASIELEKLATPEATSDEISPQFFTPVEDRKEVPPKKEKDVIGSSGDSWLDDYM
ncbi:hypothetical protein K490DRAFT_66914 [Saccharata proteae CBS 121410]|uniref:Uncharacterized protein n=1 Tax=Saccharata proteae CBS 121410 TaxID=1314787 RepID=A0A9P4HW64_9PEZI|nr:hypothetical protein K490DRAFT_66914 [Saccharata proteae CBS 121410]